MQVSSSVPSRVVSVADDKGHVQGMVEVEPLGGGCVGGAVGRDGGCRSSLLGHGNVMLVKQSFIIRSSC